MRVATPEGRILGGAFQYACHATTLTGEFRKVSGDWPGLAASALERRYPGSVFLPVIGCGADANPHPRSAYEHAQRHATELADSVARVVEESSLETLHRFPTGKFGYAGLAPEIPSAAQLEQQRTADNPHVARWAAKMLEIRAAMGRLPESVPMPIHVWQFGEQLTWVFLGGEVVLDYQRQLEKELPVPHVWAAAYCDDVFGYVASERMRAEGGYEVDESMIYYLQPGRWQTGAQSLIVRRVREILDDRGSELRPTTPDEALGAIRLPPGYRAELVACEPLVQDPVNVAFGSDGTAWVVEMGDYPQHDADAAASAGGRIKRLWDDDRDGRLDRAELFLGGLAYPTGAMPWREGALVIAAPEIFFAADRDGDGRAEHRETLVDGLPVGNPQHQASGFELGLDGWLHFSVGEGAAVIRSLRTGQTCDVRGRDAAWNPRTGELRATGGPTQFMPARDAFGQWFGNSNSSPLFHYVIEDRYQRTRAISGPSHQHLLQPAAAPPVLPASRTVDRFNDLYARERFTSACSSIVVRNAGWSAEGWAIGLACEPVHNLVARVRIVPDGGSFRGERPPDDAEREFFASTDPWCRPVRAVNAPDGSIWIVDMVRQVIEHPQWIPQAWQANLDVRSGAELGRIYRVRRHERPAAPLPRRDASPAALLDGLASDSGAVRDLALWEILQAPAPPPTDAIARLLDRHPTAEVRAAALGCLTAVGGLQLSHVVRGLADDDPRVVRYALQVAETLPSSIALAAALRDVPDRELDRGVDLQWVLTATRLGLTESAAQFQTVAARSQGDPWIAKALGLIQAPDAAAALLQGALDACDADLPLTAERFGDHEQTLAQLWPQLTPPLRAHALGERLARVAAEGADPPRAGDLLLLAVAARQESSAGRLGGDDATIVAEAARRVRARFRQSPDDPMLQAAMVPLLGCRLAAEAEELDDVGRLLEAEAAPEVRQGAIEALGRLGSPSAAEWLLACWPTLGAEERRSAGATLLSRPSWIEALVTALETGRVPPAELDAFTAQQLRSLEDRGLRTRCEQALGRPTDRARVVEAYLASLPAPAGTPGGERLYAAHCAVCHEPRGDAAAIGPTLSGLGHWTLDQWVAAILDPNRAVEAKYRQTAVVTREGQTFTGVVVRQSRTALQLAASDGSLKQWDRDALERVDETPLSLMPEGWELTLSADDVAALIGYLKSR
jgi:putative membrane-bound dehydrogenase-like protein